MRKIYTILVAIFWFGMMGLLFQREVLPTFIIANPSGYKIEVTKDNPARESWMGIYFRDKKIGFSSTVVMQDIDNGVAGYRINETTFLRLNLLGQERVVRIKGSSFFNENYILENFDYKLVSDKNIFNISGALKGDDLSVEFDVAGDKNLKTFKIKKDALIYSSISPLLLFKKIDKDREIKFEVFDPVTFGTKTVTVRKIGEEILSFNKRDYNTSIFEIDLSGLKTKSWLTETGDVLKEESVLGFTMRKEGEEDALRIAHTLSLSDQDIALEFSLPFDKEIKEPRAVSYLKIEKNGVELEIFKDSEPPLGGTLSIPIEEIEEENFIQSNDPEIKGLARKIVGDEKDSWIASKRIMKWVYGNIRKTPTISVPSSVDVLRTMEGDCNEHTVLFTALSRSMGIPTKMVAGLVCLEGRFYYHAWPRVYVGKWVNMDPTLGQEIADAAHIPLLEGGIKEQVGLINMIQELKIKVIEYK